MQPAANLRGKDGMSRAAAHMPCTMLDAAMELFRLQLQGEYRVLHGTSPKKTVELAGMLISNEIKGPLAGICLLCEEEEA